jgi:hypothetical protein
LIGQGKIDVGVGLFASGACSLLAPSDESLLGGDFARAGAPEHPDRRLDVPPQAPEDGSPRNTADQFSAEDASVFGADASAESSGEATDGADATDATEGGDAVRSCTDADQCEPGSFCTPLGRCRPCGDPTTWRDLSVLEFGPEEPLTATNDAAGLVHLKNPRAFDDTGKLLYERNLFGGQIWLTPDPMQTPGAPLPIPIDTAGFSESGALTFRPKAGPLASFNFFFDAEVERGTERVRELFGGTINSEGYAPAVTRLPAPFNPPPSGKSWSAALALSQSRAVWVASDGSILVQMMTARLGETTASVLQVPDANGCRPNQLGWSPWLTPNGRVLFFSAVERTRDCQVAPEYPPLDIYVVELDDDGRPVGHGVPLRGASRPAITEGDGSLSPDQCWLYYARDTSAGARLYRARRVR